MRTLKLANGHTIAVNDGSTISYLEVSVENYAAIDPIRAEFTPENFKHCSLDEDDFHQMVTEEFKTAETPDGLVAIMTTRPMTVAEVQAEQIRELQDAVMELAEAF